jgi:hypothetical protein
LWNDWVFLLTGFAVERVLKEQRRLESEEEVAEQGLLQAQKLVNEHTTRLMRLRKQKRSLLSKGREMVRRNLESLDALEEQERLAELNRVGGGEFGIMENVGDVADWGPMNISDFDLTGLGGLDSLGGIGEQAAGNAGGS